MTTRATYHISRSEIAMFRCHFKKETNAQPLDGSKTHRTNPNRCIKGSSAYTLRWYVELSSHGNFKDSQTQLTTEM